MLLLRFFEGSKGMKKNFLSGLMVLLPLALLVAAFNWLFKFTTNLIQPLTDLVVRDNNLPEIVGDVIVVLLILTLCLAIGKLVTTRFGKWVHRHFDHYLQRMAPGYRLIKEVVEQFFGDASKSPFANGEVAKARIFGMGSESEVTAIVTSKHPNGDFTVFVPTGPNPTSGNMYHLKPEQVTLQPQAKVEDMMRTIIACGGG